MRAVCFEVGFSWNQSFGFSCHSLGSAQVCGANGSSWCFWAWAWAVTWGCCCSSLGSRYWRSPGWGWPIWGHQLRSNERGADMIWFEVVQHRTLIDWQASGKTKTSNGQIQRESINEWVMLIEDSTGHAAVVGAVLCDKSQSMSRLRHWHTKMSINHLCD